MSSRADRLAALPLRPELRGSSPYGAPQLEVPIRLNTNENPYPPSAALVADLAASVAAAGAELHRYPDRDALALRADLADYVARATGVLPAVEQVWAANGSNEVIAQLLQAFGGAGRTALGATPSYSMHPRISELTQTGWDEVVLGAGYALDVPALLAAIGAGAPDVVFLTRPNNPTGVGVALDVVAEVYARTTGLLVVDEAYAEFSAEPSAVTLLPGRERLVVSRTMSKAFALAGGRLGYLVAAPEVVDAVQLVRLPYHLSVLGQAGARAALRHADDTLATVALVVASRERLARSLSGLGLTVVPSDANFLLVGGLGDERAVWQALVDRGVLVRDVGIAGHLRITVGTDAECDRLLAALAEVLDDRRTR